MDHQPLKFIQSYLQKTPHPVKLVAVTKYADLKTTQSLIDAGVRAIAENRVEAAAEKFLHLSVSRLPAEVGGIEKHFIGQIQSQKIRKIVELFDVIQSVGSIEHLNKIDRIASEMGKEIKLFLQFNISGGIQKSGFKTDQLHLITQALSKIQTAQVIGLMGMASDSHPKLIHQQFKSLRQLRDQLQEQFPAVIQLSMGMSSDYQIAIEEGATVVRMGRGILG